MSSPYKPNCNICGKFVGSGGVLETAHDGEVLEAYCEDHTDCHPAAVAQDIRNWQHTSVCDAPRKEE